MEEIQGTRDELIAEITGLRSQLDEIRQQCSACPIEGLDQSECIDFLQSVISAITEPILILDSNLQCVYANKSFKEVFGIDPETIMSESVYSIGNGLLDIPGLRNMLDELLSIHRDFSGYEARLDILNVGERILSLSATDVHRRSDAERLLLLSFIDITEQRRAEMKQREEEERYRSLFETSRDAIMILEPPEWTFTSGNRAAVDMFGCSSLEDFTSKQPWELSPEYQPDGQVSSMKAKEMIERAVENGANFFEWTHRRVDGVEFPATVLLSRIEIRNEKMLQATVRDITGRKQVEEELSNHRFRLEELVRERTAELEESENKYRTLVEQSHDGIYIYGAGRFLFVNDRFCQQTAYNRDEILSMSFQELIVPEQRERLREDGTVIDVYTELPNVFQLKLLRKDRETRHIEFSVRSMDYGQEEAVLGIARDITMLKQLEEEQNRIEKLESLGLLAGGIAHDFNNILTAVLGNISLARTMVEPGSDLYEILTSSEHAASKASRLTRQLLTFSRGGDPVKRCFSVAELLRETSDFVLSGSNVSCELDIPDDLHRITADRDQLGQVFSNIILNAAQAMPAGGKVRVQAGNCDGPKETDGAWIQITVSDDGYGIADEHLGRLFDPFYTTRQDGTGLGLATAYSIVRKHSGQISVQTEVGKGTAFTVVLPAGSPKDEKEKAPDFPEPKGARILVMDDKSMVRNTLLSILGRLGYSGDTAVDGRETLSKYQDSMKEGKPFDAVILDLTIPNGMGGEETIEELLDLDPDVRAIVSSGYSNSPVLGDYRAYGFQGMIMKPYSIEGLSEVLQKVLSD